MSRVCPTPHKHAYPTKQRALETAAMRKRKAMPLRVYRCECGEFHLTKQTLRP